MEEEEILSDAQIIKEYWLVSEEDNQALRRFVRLITVQLGAEESDRLTTLVMSEREPGDAIEAGINAILDEDGQRRGKWVLIQVDW
ncbi:hypothetical protein ABEQ23_12355, partial [Cutibacterium acnes]